MHMRARMWGIGVWLGGAAVMAASAFGADTGAGSKNFNVPSSVPNYFSNEGSPMIGGAAETRHGPLYTGQSYATAPPARPSLGPVVAVAPVPTRQRVALAEPRGRALRSRDEPAPATHRVVLRAAATGRAAAHGARVVHAVTHVSTPARIAAHGGTRAQLTRTAPVGRAAPAHAAASRGTARVSTVHHRGRG